MEIHFLSFSSTVCPTGRLHSLARILDWVLSVECSWPLDARLPSFVDCTGRTKQRSNWGSDQTAILPSITRTNDEKTQTDVCVDNYLSNWEQKPYHELFVLVDCVDVWGDFSPQKKTVNLWLCASVTCYRNLWTKDELRENFVFTSKQYFPHTFCVQFFQTPTLSPSHSHSMPHKKEFLLDGRNYMRWMLFRCLPARIKAPI